jgi:hypothetical protein
MNNLTSNEIIKECRLLAKEQGVKFQRCKTIGKIGDFACYEIESGICHKSLYQGKLVDVWENLLSETYSNQ